MLTITTRLTLGYIASFGAIMVAIAVAMYLAFAQNERASLDDELRDYAEFLVSDVGPGVSSASDLFDRLQELTTQANLRFRQMRFMLTTRDSLIYESGMAIEPLVDSLESLLAWKGHPPFTTLAVGDTEYRIFTMAIPERGAEGLGMVVVAPLNRLHQALARLRNLLLVIVPCSVLIASIGGWYTARKALDPVSKIRAAAARISLTNLQERVPEGNQRDELTELARTFNDMIIRLEETFTGQRRFIADASHDLRTPLMVIQTKLDRLLGRDDVPADVREDLRHCSGEAERLARIAADLLLLARADAGELQMKRAPERLDELLIESVARMKELAAARDISMRVDVEEPLELLCDAPALQRALANILDNAIAHSPPAGTVSTMLEVGREDAVISITDTGRGISAEDLPRVFDRFYRGDAARSTRGSGLGLAIASTIVEAHGGSIDIISAPNQGTTVQILLPRQHPVPPRTTDY